ncbi:hypothetical protein VTN77DRAFT_4976 [Rasamsonia byssochlamydoides]|uniref:uncharacterized protein n=1 Tax=Rasamsonia byssochlamydoides TaxID=89139 RepID=UPI003743EC46
MLFSFDFNENNPDEDIQASDTYCLFRHDSTDPHSSRRRDLSSLTTPLPLRGPRGTDRVPAAQRATRPVQGQSATCFPASRIGFTVPGGTFKRPGTRDRARELYKIEMSPGDPVGIHRHHHH